MKRAFVCLLALCAAVLTACGHPAATLPLEGGEPAGSPAPEPWEITGQLAEYTGGHVDMALTIPDGWTWETLEEDGQAGLRFRKTEDPAVDFRLTCWTDGYGICGTGVTSEEITLANGMKVWQHTEENTEKGTMVMADIFFEDVPGSYVASPSETMTTEVWNANRDALLSILGTAQIGRKSVSQQAAIDAAKAQYTGAYDQVYATYDVTSGAWTVSFSKSAAGAKTDRLVVDAAGKVMAAGK